jgi:phosphoglycerate-specific signal transduction histidine kinase
MNNPSDLTALQARCESLQREQAELARFALIGQAFIGLTHELNNALNSMMLQTSVVQMRVDEKGRQELAAIRQHGAQAAGLVRTLQHAVQERREKSYAVDLNSMLAEILDEESELHHSVSLVLSQKTPVIQSTRSAVKQLIRLLLEGACAGKQTTVTVATGEQGGGAVLSLTLTGPQGEESIVEMLLWQNLDEVGRLAGQSLLRQLGGTLTAEQTGNEHIFRVTWRQAS